MKETRFGINLPNFERLPTLKLHKFGNIEVDKITNIKLSQGEKSMKKGFLSVVLASLLAVTSINAQSSEEVNRETVHQAKVDAKSHYVKLIEEAVNALALTSKGSN